MANDNNSSNIWNIFHGCDCLKEILQKSGFDRPEFLYNLTEFQLNQLEENINRNKTIFSNIELKCSHMQNYKNNQNFAFLPGHRLLILNFAQTNTLANTSKTFEYPAFSILLQNLIQTALNNYNKPATHNRYPELLMDFAIYIYIMAGKACYEVIAANLPMPSASTILKHIQSDKEHIVEGELRAEQLNKYLELIKSPKHVFLSEDASGIVKKVVYDIYSNQLVGIVMPFNDANGMPKMFSFEARNAEDIEKYLNLPQSTLVYIIVAQPLMDGAAPFILQIFGTDNKFKTDDVLSRWAHTEAELNKFNINVVGVSSDGDSRLLRAMMNVMKFNLTPGSNLDDFNGDFLACVQDTIHEGTKMRNRLLNPSILLYMGNEIVSIIHIKMLMEKVSKEVHGLVQSDILPEDRQNYSSLEKLMESRVINALEKSVADSKGTIMYLELCKQITSSYLEDDLEPVERVYRMWHALYFLRGWRKWIQSSDNEYTLNENFISRNLFLCVELNSHALVYLISRLRSNQQMDLFIPSKFASQPCESIFRQMRSMGTTNFTKINFTLYEVLHMTARVDLLNKIVYSRVYSSNEIKFPRSESKLFKERRSIVPPSDQQILDAMKRARKDALENLIKFGMDLEEDAITNFDASFLTKLSKRGVDSSTDREYSIQDQLEEDELYDDDDHDIGLNADVNVLEQLFEETSCIETPTKTGPDGSLASRVEPAQDENQSRCQLSEKTGFIEIVHSDGSTSNVRKSTFVWKLLENNGKLSSDRLKRVQGQSNYTAPKRRKIQKESSTERSLELREEEQILFKATDIEVGDWAIFKINDETVINRQNSKQFVEKNCLFGLILGFKNFNEKGQLIQYKYRYAKTPFNVEYKVNLHVLGAWYICNESGNLIPVENKKKIKMCMENYIATMNQVVMTRKNAPENSKLTYEIPCEFSKLTTSLLNIFLASFLA